MRLLLLLPFLLPLLSLSACQLPQPFAHVGPVKDNALLELPYGKGVRVTTAPDVAPEFAEPLTEATVKALSEVGIAASTDATRPVGYVLVGDVELSRESEDGPEVAAFAWRLTSQSGKPVGAFDQKIDGGDAGWLARDPEMFNVVAHDAGPQIAAMLEKDNDNGETVDGATEAAVPANEPPKIYLNGVTGAPGDGNAALSRALAEVLKKSGAVMVDSEDQATLLLSGTVSTTPQNDGISQVTISWILVDKSGAQLSKIDQKNPVRTALIAVRWGNLANLVAEGAADGVMAALDAVNRPADSSRRLAVPH